jgi:hypothetical protein
MTGKWNDKIFDVDPTNFDELALEIFHFQYQHNSLYKAYADILKVQPSRVKSIDQIPFLPIGFFKTHKVQTTTFDPEIVFESSGTTTSTNSHHLVKDLGLYRQGFLKTFEGFYGSPDHLCIIGLLPSYLERQNSSLVYMVDEFFKRSANPSSCFYLTDFDKLYNNIHYI